MKTKTLNDSASASDPGQIRLSRAKLRRFHPELYEPRGLWRLLKRLSPMQRFWQTRREEHLLYGDSRAAIVMATTPLLIAAYTDELDCIAMLIFPDELVHEYDLEVGSRLLTVNLYTIRGNLVADLEHGPASYHRYSNFGPMIAEFFSNDMARIKQRRSEIEETEWAHTQELAEAYLTKRGKRYRDGRPMCSMLPARLWRDR